MKEDPVGTLIGLLEGMLSSKWQRPSDSKIQLLLAELRANRATPTAPAEKLVRNGPGQRIQADNGRVRVAGEHEMPLLLARKLVEEAQEVLAAIQGNGPHADVVEELADVTEVIRGLRQVTHIRKDDVRAARRAKRMRKGDFEQRLVWSRE